MVRYCDACNTASMQLLVPLAAFLQCLGCVSLLLPTDDQSMHDPMHGVHLDLRSLLLFSPRCPHPVCIASSSICCLSCSIARSLCCYALIDVHETICLWRAPAALRSCFVCHLE